MSNDSLSPHISHLYPHTCYIACTPCSSVADTHWCDYQLDTFDDYEPPVYDGDAFDDFQWDPVCEAEALGTKKCPCACHPLSAMGDVHCNSCRLRVRETLGGFLGCCGRFGAV